MAKKDETKVAKTEVDETTVEAKEEAVTEANTEAQIDELIEKFNTQFVDFAEITKIDASEKEDLVKDIKTRFEHEMSYWRKDKGYQIADAKHANYVLTLIRDWNNKYAQWSRAEYRGVVRFAEQLKKINLKEGDNLELDFAAVTYLYALMMKPAGAGIESAQWMYDAEYDANPQLPEQAERNYLTYSEVLEVLAQHMNDIAKSDKKIQVIQQEWGMAEGLMKLNYKFDTDSLDAWATFFEKLKNEPELK